MKNEKRYPLTPREARPEIYSFIWIRSHTKGPREYHMKRQELSAKAPAAGLLPLLRGFLWMPLPWRSGHAICSGCTGEFIMALTALRIVTLNEIVEQYVRPDPLRRPVEVFSPCSRGGRQELGERERREPSPSHMQG